MSPKIKRLSGREAISILSKFGFSVYSQKGSRVELSRILSSGVIQSLTIPMHDELDIGTLRAIIKQASRFVTEDQLRREFYFEVHLPFSCKEKALFMIKEKYSTSWKP